MTPEREVAPGLPSRPFLNTRDVLIVLAFTIALVFLLRGRCALPKSTVRLETELSVGQPANQLRQKIGAPYREYTRAQIDQKEVDFPIKGYTEPGHLPSYRVLIYGDWPASEFIAVYVDKAGIVTEILILRDAYG